MTNHSHRHPLPGVELLFVDCGKLGIGLSVSSSCVSHTVSHAQRLEAFLRETIPFDFSVKKEATVTYLGGRKILNGADRKNLMSVQMFILPSHRLSKKDALRFLQDVEFKEGLYLEIQGSDHICATAN